MLYIYILCIHSNAYCQVHASICTCFKCTYKCVLSYIYIHYCASSHMHIPICVSFDERFCLRHLHGPSSGLTNFFGDHTNTTWSRTPVKATTPVLASVLRIKSPFLMLSATKQPSSTPKKASNTASINKPPPRLALKSVAMKIK